MGIKKDDKVALLANDGPGWGIVYLGIQASGAVVVPVDRLMPPSGMRHIISDSEARILFTSSEYIKTLSEMEPLNNLEKVISFDSNDDGNVILFDKVLIEGEQSFSSLPQRDLDELAAILYTSGTTGFSKGVMLSQRNIMSNVAATMQMTTLGTEDTFLSLMPMHHAYQCTNGFLHPLYIGSSITYARRLRSAEILEDIKQSNVTVMGAVPLLYDKLKAGIIRNVNKKGTIAKILFRSLMNISIVGEFLNLDLGKFTFKGLRKKAGMGTLKYFITGGAAIDPATSKFFNRFGILMLQGFGITETSPLTHFTPPTKIRHECVGLPIPDLECKIASPDDNGVGELYIKGPNVFMGYYKNQEATKESFDEEGWFKTGDLGIIHKDGYLQITGRKKNLIVTAGGKNIYPEEIEHYLLRSDFIAEAVVLGVKGKTKFAEEVGALIYPDYENIDLYFEEREQNLTEKSVNDLIKAEIKQKLRELPSYKQVRSFRIHNQEFEKTSTRKIKRFLYNPEMLAVELPPA